MKNIKKSIGILSLSLILVSLLSGIAYANVGYNFQLPSTGSKYTNFENKPNKGTTAYNYARYVGWSDTINCWANSNSNSQLSSTASYRSSGTVSMYYPGTIAGYYYGHPVQMKIKTGSSVFHAINVSGEFKAS